jgi:hypothetical protein
MINKKQIELEIKKRLYIRFAIVLITSHFMSLVLNTQEPETLPTPHSDTQHLSIVINARLRTIPLEGELVTLSNESKTFYYHDIEFVQLIESPTSPLETIQEGLKEILIKVSKDRASKILRLKHSLVILPHMKGINLMQKTRKQHEIIY